MKVYFNKEFTGFLTYKSEPFVIERYVESIDEAIGMFKKVEFDIEKLKNDFLLQLKEIYRDKFSKTDEIMLKYYKREKLNMLTKEDIDDFKKAIEEYRMLMVEYEKIKEEVKNINNLDVLKDLIDRINKKEENV